MAAPTKVNFKIHQGGTFKEILRWETSSKTYKVITAITKAAPIVITAVGHGIPVGWRAKVTDVVGMKEINSADVYHTVTSATTDTVTINAINSSSYTAYVSGGVLEYNTPRSLSGVTARMQIRSTLTDSVVIDELTTENGKLVIDDALKTITILVSATATALYDFSSAVYSLELIDGAEVIPFVYGTLTLVKEITR
jgi:hypothetical protein